MAEVVGSFRRYGDYVGNIDDIIKNGCFLCSNSSIESGLITSNYAFPYTEFVLLTFSATDTESVKTQIAVCIENDSEKLGMMATRSKRTIWRAWRKVGLTDL